MSSPRKREAQESSGKQQDREDWESYVNLDGSDSADDSDQMAAVEEQEKAQVSAPAPSPIQRRPTKKQRRGKNSPEPDYSAMVQGQMAGIHRTGQACDRCKPLSRPVY
ncbi:predicted protein [Uncinocarpus reesii 1704]|uniref:Uncharacterized protein n=1 Tax=Uncinocarpus reesii (strain UAMH 1704) TaxID=336963 RepID=C4JJE9_UNCRE|nr:uncharacterized protein UREG_01756 [Uncinocarpus reesii 1704]EEP76907.1 predicted protein [Uncinocarpus reesii 1704]